jgi:hypothetical protein
MSNRLSVRRRRAETPLASRGGTGFPVNYDFLRKRCNGNTNDWIKLIMIVGR